MLDIKHGQQVTEGGVWSLSQNNTQHEAHIFGEGFLAFLAGLIENVTRVQKHYPMRAALLLATTAPSRYSAGQSVNHARPDAFAVLSSNQKRRPMLKRDRLKTMLEKITDKQFNAVWKDTYGYVPIGDRADLVADFVAEQYDGELDDSIKRAESLLKPAAKPKLNRWLVPH